MNKGSYTGDEKVIAAHEYGHLIGIPDEYSQSNVQLNALCTRRRRTPRRAPAPPSSARRSSGWCSRSRCAGPLLSAGRGDAVVTDALRAKRTR